MRVVVNMVLVLTIIGGTWVAWAARNGGEERFCTLGLGITTIDGRTVILQDQGGPGPDGCDLGKTDDEDWVLGFDCVVRSPSGRVEAVLPVDPASGECDLTDQ